MTTWVTKTAIILLLAPLLDVRMQTGQAAAEALELRAIPAAGGASGW